MRGQERMKPELQAAEWKSKLEGAPRGRFQFKKSANNAWALDICLKRPPAFLREKKPVLGK